MDLLPQSMIDSLARQIVAHAIQDSWGFWLSTGALVFVCAVLGNYVASYFAKRGEVGAAKADRQEILNALRASAKATEEVKSAITLGEWSERERRTLLRTRLEDMMLLAYKTQDWLTEELNRVANPGLPETPSPLVTLRTYGRLYFPQLRERVRAFGVACGTHSENLGQTRIAVMKARHQHPPESQEGEHAASVAIEAASETLAASAAATTPPLLELEDAAARLMVELIAVPPQ